MSKPTPTPEQVLTALSTPPRDMRDEVWVRVYALEYARARERHFTKTTAECVEIAAAAADLAVRHMPIPAHRRADAGLPPQP